MYLSTSQQFLKLSNGFKVNDNISTIFVCFHIECQRIRVVRVGKDLKDHWSTEGAGRRPCQANLHHLSSALVNQGHPRSLEVCECGAHLQEGSEGGSAELQPVSLTLVTSALGKVVEQSILSVITGTYRTARASGPASISWRTWQLMAWTGALCWV